MEEIMIVVWLFYMLFVLALSVGFYVLQSLGLYTIAKRRHIDKPWLAWVPVGNMWILGCISDQYQYVVKAAVCNKRKVLAGLTVAMYVAMIPLYVLYFMVIFASIGGYFGMSDMFASVGIMLVFAAILSILALVAVVFQYMALYDYFRSCEPDNATLFLILSIFFSAVMPIFMFAVRNKDQGMPPRRPVQPTYQQPPQWQQPPEV